ncbi:MAG: ATPase, partial [Halanaerobium sp.]|nr:ATPase [Halanaerobium sp.]
HFVEAIDKVIMGEKLDRKPERSELNRIALHEGGHALVAELVNPGSVSQVTITSRGQALGYVRHLPDGDRYLMTQEYLEGQIAICIAGAISEEIFLSNRSTGAKSDFMKALSLAEEMIDAGMTPLGVVNGQNLPVNLKHETTTAIIREQEDKVKCLLQKRTETLERIAEILLESERLDGEDLRDLIGSSRCLAG